MNRLVIALSAVAMLSSAAIAGDAPAKKVVPFGDLNLNTQEGVVALHDRLIAAASEVCATSASAELSKDAGYEACRKAAVRNAVAEVSTKLSSRLASIR